MSRILETILPDSIRNEGLLFVPQILEDLMRGKLDREFPVRLEEGEDPVSARTYSFDVARRLYKNFADALTQANYKIVTRKFVVNLLDNALGWTFDKTAALADSDLPFLLAPMEQALLEDESNNQTTQTIKQFPVVVCPHMCSLDESNTRYHGWGLSSASRSATRFAQEFINARDEYLWSIVTNGKELRLVRDNPSLTRPSFLSFDLGAILGGAGDFAAFAFMWRMLHGSRVDTVPLTLTSDLDLSAQHSLWESLHSRSAETGVRALTGLRSGVVAAIEVLGTGLLKRNPSIREALQDGTLSVQEYEQELLRLAYRFLFLFVAEERRLLHTPGTSEAVKKLYREGYSMARLRRIAARYAAGSSDRHIDLYEGVRLVFAGLAHGEPRLGLTALGGIFSDEECAHLRDATLANADLIAAMRALRYIDAGKKLFPVNYRDMGAEEFGSVYEGILELVPNYTAATQTFSLVGAAGNNRKTTGSYYTPSSLVDKQVESALIPLIDRCLKTPDPEKALLALRVIDTSCGSGHFDVAGARRLATSLVEVRGNDSSPEAYQRALRDVISNCIYGVDINPLAVELAKITLWIESVVPGQPLSFLDAHFVCGDATLGIDRLKNLENGIPAAAYKPLPGDDKATAQELGKKNRAELKVLEKERKSGQLHLPTDTGDLSSEIAKVALMPELTLAEVEAKKAAYAKYLSGASSNRLVQAANLFTAAFLLPKASRRAAEAQSGGEVSDRINRIYRIESEKPAVANAENAKDAKSRKVRDGVLVASGAPVAPRQANREGDADCCSLTCPFVARGASDTPDLCGSAPLRENIPTTSNLLSLLTGSLAYEPPTTEMQTAADAACRKARVLHWPLVFPEVFEKGGFDCILTNPPWDRVKLQEKEFFAAHDPAIAEAQNAAQRKKLIDALPQTNPSLYASFQQALRRADVVSTFIHESGRFILSNVGDVNLYSILAETILHVKSPNGFAGAVLPTGICTDDSNKQLFAALVNQKQLVSFLSFENEERLFADVHHSFKFALVTMGAYEQADFSFFNRQVATLADERRHFTLSAEDFRLINPNTLTAPIFRTKADAELAKKIYRKVGVLWDETREDGNPWGISFKRLFDMSNDSALFVTEDQLPTALTQRTQSAQSNAEVSLRTSANSAFFASAPAGYLPLYEAKMIHQFDHRWTTYEPGEPDVRDVTLDEKQNAFYEPLPRYWVERKCVCGKFDGNPPAYLMGWRDVTNAIALRTDVASVIPLTAVGHKFQLFFTKLGANLDACLLGDMDSLVHDWCSRQKVGGVSFSYSYKRQIPTLSPTAYTQADIDFIVPRVLELTYTSNSLKPWAEALGYAGEPFRFDPERRATLRAELDARYAKLYGLNEPELTYILDPSAVYGPDYPSESFRVLKEKEIAEFGEFRTMRMVLEAFRKDVRS